MIISKGDKIHIMTRRQFDGDLRRHFAGIVVECDAALVRVEGYTFIYDEKSSGYVRKHGVRTRIFDLAESGHIVNVIPSNADIEKLAYTKAFEKNLVITDGEQFSLDVNEFGGSS